MIKAGSILAVIGSVVSLLSALSTFSIGQTAERFGVDGSEMAISAGAIGIVMAVSSLIMGLACFFEPKRIYGLLMVIIGVLGILIGNMTYATGMFLILFGGAFVFRQFRKIKEA